LTYFTKEKSKDLELSTSPLRETIKTNENNKEIKEHKENKDSKENKENYNKQFKELTESLDIDEDLKTSDR